jgi:IS605 OrfB family transposase
VNSIITSIRLELIDMTPEFDDLLYTRLLRPQSAAKRFAYSRLSEEMEKKLIWNWARKLFPLLTGRSINDAIMSAEAILKSQHERLPELVQNVKRRIEKTEEKLQRELGQAEGARAERVSAMQKRLAGLTAKRDAWQAHLDHGTVPPAMFGGRKLWREVERAMPGAKEEWREARTDEFISRGACNYQGNPHCRLVIEADNHLCFRVRVPDGAITKGNRPTTKARWLGFDVGYSRQYESLLRQVARDGADGKGQYTVRLLRLSPDHYRAYVTLEEPVAHREYAGREPLPEWCMNVAGIDLNLDHVALALTDQQGQFRGWQVFKFPNLGELPRNKSEWQIGNLACGVIQWAKGQGVQAIVLEDLNIDQTGGGTNFNRRTVPFSYRQLADALSRTALRNGLAVKRINPAYTSWIGELKYTSMYGISVHIAAAYVIARRGFGLQERLPARLIRQFPALITSLEVEIAELQQKEEKTEETQKSLVKRREWLRRLTHWKECSPESGRPWLLWATLKAMSSTSVGRAILCSEPAKVTYGRKDTACRLRSAGNTRPNVAPGNRSGPPQGDIELRT